MSALSWLIAALAIWSAAAFTVASVLGLLIRRANRKALILRRGTTTVGTGGTSTPPVAAAFEVQTLQAQGVAVQSTAPPCRAMSAR